MKIIKFFKIFISSESIFHKDKNLNDYLEYHNGDIYDTNGSFHTVGRITSATKELNFTIVLDKNVEEGLNVVVNKCNLTVRTLNGYINDDSNWRDYATMSSYTITASVVNRNKVSINITKSSAFTNVSNNTPVVVSCDLNLTFKKWYANSNFMLGKLILKFKKIMIDSSSIFHKGKKLDELLELQQFQPGETLTIPEIVLSGLITSGSTSVKLNYTFPKSIHNVNITVDTLSCEARGTKGYLNGTSGYQNFMTSGYEVSILKSDDFNVLVNVVKTSAFTNVDNNTPVVFRGKITFKFS